jgi:hypothetical protein
MVALLDIDSVCDIGWFRHEKQDAQTKGFMVQAANERTFQIELLSSEEIASTHVKACLCLPGC